MKEEKSQASKIKWPVIVGLGALSVPVCVVLLWFLITSEILERPGEIICANPGFFFIVWLMVLGVGAMLSLSKQKSAKRVGIVLIVLMVVPACSLSVCGVIFLILLSQSGGGWQ